MKHILFILVMMLAASVPATAQILSIDNAEFVLSESDQPPGETADWQPVEFIGATRIGTRQGDRRVWYRFRLDYPNQSGGEIYSLYFWRYNMSITVFMNGQELGGDSFREGRQTLAWNHPRLVDIQSSSWLPGSNTFFVRYNPSPFGGTFGGIKFGPHDQLYPVWEKMYTWKVRINEYLLVFGGIVAGGAFLLWAFRRRDSVYLWFFGVAVCWCAVMTHMVIYYNPIPYQYWLPLVHLAIDGWILCLFCFTNRLLEFRHRKLERAMMVLFAAAVCSHLFTPREIFWVSAYVFHVILTSGLLFLFVRVLLRAVIDRQPLAIAVCLAVLGQVLFSAHDYWLFFAAESVEWEQATHLSQFGVPLILLVFMFTLLKRFNDALAESENLNRDLESRVEAGRQSLEQSFQKNRKLELDQAASQEREKIYRDLHDNVGSKLLSIVHSLSDQRGVDLAASALQSLREAVYRTNYNDEPLLDFLTNMREETKARVTGRGMACDWFEDPDLTNRLLASRYCYHISRIVREAVSNALMYSHGSLVTVSIERVEGSPDQLQIEITDDGGGIDPSVTANSHGSGIGNIHHRAESLGAVASWSQREGGGTRLVLLLTPEYIETAAEA